MSNRSAIVILLVLGIALAINFAFGLEAHIFLGKRALDIVNFLVFWR